MQEHDIKSQMQSKPSKYKILFLEKKIWGHQKQFLNEPQWYSWCCRSRLWCDDFQIIKPPNYRGLAWELWNKRLFMVTFLDINISTCAQGRHGGGCHDACHDSQKLCIILSIKWKLMTQFKTIIINIVIVKFFVVINNWQAEKWPFYIWAGVLRWKFFWCWVAGSLGSLIWVLSVKFSIWYRTGLVINISLLSSSAVSLSCHVNRVRI